MGSEHMAKYISIDIGGTSIKYGIVEEPGRILRRCETETESFKGGPAIVKKVISLVEGLLKEWDAEGICISTAGIVDCREGAVIYSAPLIPEYTGTRWKEIMEKRFGLPCEVENDVNCAGLAEFTSGSAAGSRSALVLTIGTGIGGCMIADGQVWHGRSSSACEVGYMKLPGGDFQDLGASRVMTKKVAAWKNQPEELWDGRRIFREAAQGDVLCLQAINEMAEVLGMGIANLCYILNPEVVVLGGGIMAQREVLKEKIEESVRRYLIPYIAENTKITFAAHENEAGMLGAFYHFRKARIGAA